MGREKGNDTQQIAGGWNRTWSHSCKDAISVHWAPTRPTEFDDEMKQGRIVYFIVKQPPLQLKIYLTRAEMFTDEVMYYSFFKLLLVTFFIFLLHTRTVVTPEVSNK